METDSRQVQNRPRLLITGASGMLGDALCRLASRKWEVCGVYQRHPVRISGVRPVQCDLTDSDDTDAMLDRIDPQGVIHAAADSRVTACEADPRRTEAINVRAPERLAAACARRRIDFVFTSSDLVFDGRGAPYDERALVHPVCVYGHQKVRAEEAVLRRHPDALVCRLPLMFGLAPNAMHHFTVQMLQAIQAGRPIRLLVDEYRTPVDNRSAASGILALLGRHSGVLHLGGRSRVSRFEMGLLMAGFLNRTPHMLQPTTIAALDIGVTRSPDCSLDSRNAFVLGYAPTPLADALQHIARHFNKKSGG